MREEEWETNRPDSTNVVTKKRCKCGSEFFFARRRPEGERPGNWTPMSEVRPPAWAVGGERYFQPHFLNCPNANEFSGKGRRRR